jgi:hypothetical protein
MLSPWDRFLHWLWRRVGEPGMQCRGPHVEPGDRITVRFIELWGNDDRVGVVNSVIGDRVTHIVLREETAC